MANGVQPDVRTLATKLVSSPEYQQADAATKAAMIESFRRQYVLSGSASKSPTPSKPPAGFFDRFLEGMGLPSSMKELEGLKPSLTRPPIEEIVPALAAARMAIGYGRNVGRAAQEAQTETSEAFRNIFEGGPIKANVGKALYASERGLMRGPLSLAGGGTLQNFGEDVAAKNIAGAAGDATAVVTQALLLKGAKPYSPEARAAKLTFATGAGDTAGIFKATRKALSDIQEVVRRTGPVRTVGDYVDTVQTALTKLGNEYGIGLQPIRGTQVSTQSIADGIRRRAARLPSDPDSIRLAKRLEKEAMEYHSKLMSVEELDNRRETFWQREFKGKEQPVLKSPLKSDVDSIVNREVATGVQDVIYPMMDRANGKPPGYFADLQGRRSSLIRIDKQLGEEVNKLSDSEAKRIGSPWLSSENVTAYAHAPSGMPGVRFHRLQAWLRSPAKARDISVQRALTRPSVAKLGTQMMVLHYPVSVLLREKGEGER